MKTTEGILQEPYEVNACKNVFTDKKGIYHDDTMVYVHIPDKGTNCIYVEDSDQKKIDEAAAYLNDYAAKCKKKCKYEQLTLF